jgi:hypothetical protein
MLLFKYGSQAPILASGMDARGWVHIAMVLISGETIGMFSNGAAILREQFEYTVAFAPGASTALGCDAGRTDFFIGFLYSFVYTMHPVIQFNISEDGCTIGYCQTCPKDTCLIDCGVDQTLSNNQCVLCEASCT